MDCDDDRQWEKKLWFGEKIKYMFIFSGTVKMYFSLFILSFILDH